MAYIKYDEKEPLGNQIRKLIEKDTSPNYYRAKIIMEYMKEYVLDKCEYEEKKIMEILEGEVKPSTFKKIKKLIKKAFEESCPEELFTCNDAASTASVESAESIELLKNDILKILKNILGSL